MALPQEAPTHNATTDTDAVTDSIVTPAAVDRDTPNYILRRAAAFGLVALLAVGAIEAGRAVVERGQGRPNVDRSQPVNYRVQPGDTAWDIANRYNTGGEVRELVDDITDQGPLQPGTDITVPGPHPGDR